MQLPIPAGLLVLYVAAAVAFCVGGKKGKREISTMAFGADVPFPSPSFRAGRMDGWINPMSSHAVVVALAILCAAMLQARFHTYLARRGQHDGGGRDADEF